MDLLVIGGFLRKVIAVDECGGDTDINALG